MKVFWGWRCCVCRFIFGIEIEIVFTVHLEICRTALLDDLSWQVSLVLYFFGFFYLLLSCISISVCLTVHLVEKLASDWRFQVGAFLRAANWWKLPEESWWWVATSAWAVFNLCGGGGHSSSPPAHHHRHRHQLHHHLLIIIISVIMEGINPSLLLFITNNLIITIIEDIPPLLFEFWT